MAPIGTNGFQFYLSVEIANQPTWQWKGWWNKTRSVDVTNATIGVSLLADGSTFYLPANAFPASKGPFRSISSDGTFACATKDSTETVYCVTNATTKWQPLGGKLTQIAVRSGKLFGVGSNGTLWTTTLQLSSDNPDGGYTTLDEEEKAAEEEEAKAAEKVSDLQRSKDKQTSAKEATAATGTNDILADWANDETLQAMRIPLKDLEYGPKVSRGAFGDVYKGRYNGQIVAIKVLAESKRKSLSELAKFAQEARFMAVLQHDHIARFVGVAWNTPSDLCIVSEFLAGGDVRALLQRYVSEGRPEGFSPEKIKIALHVAHALTYLHSLQPIVLHRDLKSKNILLTEDGDAKLTDFGVSREMEDATMTAGVGSSLWMAPEIVQGERYDEKADVYSFGVVLSELDTNELPFAEAQREGVLVESQAGTGTTERKRLPEVAILQLVVQGRLSVRFTESELSAMREIGQACVAVDPTQRPTAAAVLYRIHQIWREISEYFV
ncbi:hypothetical protein P43SY_009363 [Pythium insidiosum]|uniref:Protein kinase domain-containing protein n=1 Tax=Pythium insidiosum TaxID=114742 RepID=A0AAD5L7Q9_PYTIN|nr:hypothetical protein P43SY_009363 [Pythium insidiosum]